MSILQLPPADSSPSFRTRADRQTDTHDYCMPRGSAHRGIIRPGEDTGLEAICNFKNGVLICRVNTTCSNTPGIQ